MGTLVRIGIWRIMIYTLDHPPVHVHVVGPNGRAKIALNCQRGRPLPIAAFGMDAALLTKLVDAVAERQDSLCEAWRQLHGST